MNEEEDVGPLTVFILDMVSESLHLNAIRLASKLAMSKTVFSLELICE